MASGTGSDMGLEGMSGMELEGVSGKVPGLPPQLSLQGESVKNDL
jgi:hypothetical protein